MRQKQVRQANLHSVHKETSMLVPLQGNGRFQTFKPPQQAALQASRLLHRETGWFSAIPDETARADRPQAS
jgi:hypothetical protein